MSPSGYSISTPENVDLHLELAGCGNRILAGLIDTLLIVLIIAGVCLLALGIFALTAQLPSNLGYAKQALYILMTIFLLVSIFLINFGYFIFFEGLWRGQTPGKRVAGIRVIEQNGQPVTSSAVWIRNLLRTFDQGCFVIGLMSMLIDKNERRIGDFAANTIVIRERPPRISLSDLKLTVKAGEEEHFDIGQLSPQEYELLVSFLRRRQGLDQTHRVQLAKRMTAYFSTKLHLNMTEHKANNEQLLESLFLAYQARSEL